MAADSTTSIGRAAALGGHGTGLGVQERKWTRELTEDGRVYYYDRATGKSQWHLPNDMYEGAALTVPEEQDSQATVVWPTHARATLMVDCVTEVLPEKMLDVGGPSVGGNSATNAIAAIQADPRNSEKISSFIPVFLAEYLAGENFELTCVRMFKAVVVQGDMSLPDNYDAVCDIVMSVETDPSLRLSQARFKRLMDSFLPFSLSKDGMVDTQDFVEFMQFAVAIRYLEQAAGVEG